MLREGLTISLEYREKEQNPCFCKTEISINVIEMDDKNFEDRVRYIAGNMWRKIEKELFDRA